MGYEEEQARQAEERLKQESLGTLGHLEAKRDLDIKKRSADFAREQDEVARRREGMPRSSTALSMADNPGLVAIIVAGIIGLATLYIAVVWWLDAAGTVRPILQHSPLAGAVADTPEESGSPLVVAIVLGVIWVAAMVFVSKWRRRVALRCAQGELGRAALFGSSLLRTLVLVGGITLLPAAAAIAQGQDLENPGEGFLVDLWPLAIVLIGIGLYTVISAGKVWGSTLRKLAPAEGE